MSKRGDFELVCDIKEAAGRINNYVSGLNFKRFLDDAKTQDAVVRNLEIIGEAVKNLSAEFKKDHGEIPWKKLSGMRDRLIHHYFGVNLDIVWSIVRDDLPVLITEINRIKFPK